MIDYKLLINGELVAGNDSIEVLNPATEEVLTRAPVASATQLDEAVVAAQEAFATWSETPWSTRKKKLCQLADRIDENADELALLLTREQGKPLPQAQFEVSVTSGAIRYFASVSFETEAREHAQGEYEFRRKPLGVVACITPWNFPMILASNKYAPALITGNTVVVKPAPTTPLTTLAIGHLAHDIFPAGVFNVIADNNDLGASMSSHPGIAKVSFTGSTNTGKLVMKSAANSVKRVTLELGGNDPAIVLADADIEAASTGLATTAFMNAGQVCVAPKRIYVADKIYSKFCSRFSTIVNQLRVGSGEEEGVDIGPLQNRAQYAKVKQIVETAEQYGKVIAGGDVPEIPGYFIEPTVIVDIDNEAALVQEEQFGPIVPIVRVSTADEAVALANATVYGLGASIWSEDIDMAKKLGTRLETGTVWINQHMAMGPDLPFCGAKQSGFGVEAGVEGVREYTQIQVMNVA